MATNEARRQVAMLAKTLGIEIDPDEYAANVVRTGDTIILPEGASIPEVIKSLRRQHESETQDVETSTTLNVPPWDGALALQKAITEELGMLIQNYTFDWMGRHPPQEIQVEVEQGKTMAVKWGEFELPGMGAGASVSTGFDADRESGMYLFKCTISCTRRYEKRAKKIMDKLRYYAANEMLHKGKAFSIRFHDDQGEIIHVPTPTFFPLDLEKPIFRADLEKAIERNVFTPIRHTAKMKEIGEPLKRGVLFAGDYGVGKTMLASHIAPVAVEHEWTFIYVKNPKELPQALKYAQRYQPVVVFAEDVDRVSGEERTDKVNNLLNQLDGVDSKTAAIMTILTSNHADKVTAAMRRPGRIDLILQVLYPDADTVERLARHYSRDGIDVSADLSEISNLMAGMAPAYVREAVGRARLEALRRTGGDAGALINGEDLAAVAAEVKAEYELFNGAAKGEKAEPGMFNLMAQAHTAQAELLKRAAKVNGEKRA